MNDLAPQIDDEEEVEPTFTFDQLDDRAKEKVRDRIRYSDWYLWHDWWEFVYEMADSAAALMSIAIDDKSKVGRIRQPAIYFSGFGSQGDGACFEGRWYPPTEQDAIERIFTNITEFAPQDTALHKVARELSDIAMRARHHSLSVTIKHRDNHYHSRSVEQDITLERPEDFEDWDEVRQLAYLAVEKSNGIVFESPHPGYHDSFDEGIRSALRSFMHWIYRRLEEEHDYLMSDEAVDEHINCNQEDQLYDEDGNEV